MGEGTERTGWIPSCGRLVYLFVASTAGRIARLISLGRNDSMERPVQRSNCRADVHHWVTDSRRKNSPTTRCGLSRTEAVQSTPRVCGGGYREHRMDSVLCPFRRSTFASTAGRMKLWKNRMRNIWFILLLSCWAESKHLSSYESTLTVKIPRLRSGWQKGRRDDNRCRPPLFLSHLLSHDWSRSKPERFNGYAIQRWPGMVLP